VEVSGIGYNPTGDFTLSGRALKEGETVAVERLLEIAALCNGAKIEPPSDKNAAWGVIGDPTDGALIVAALKYGMSIEDILAEKPIINIMPFDFTRKRMTTIHKFDGDFLVYMKGAPRSILSVCNRILNDDKVEDLTSENLLTAEEKIHEFANEGLRVIAVAQK
jgi:Ca2+-transporting ATPase